MVDIIEDSELENLLLENFKNALAHSTDFNKELWWHFMRCEIRKTTPLQGNVHSIGYSKNNEAIALIRAFILEHDLDGFLLFSIRQTPFDKSFTLENTIPTVFGSIESFINILIGYDEESKYKDEFLRFYHLLTENKENGVPINFFEVIPVEKRISHQED